MFWLSKDISVTGYGCRNRSLEEIIFKRKTLGQMHYNLLKDMTGWKRRGVEKKEIRSFLTELPNKSHAILYILLADIIALISIRNLLFKTL